MKYTYRYSTVQEVSISWICPICRSKKSIPQEEVPSIYKRIMRTDELCCSVECTKEYNSRIKFAIAWATNTSNKGPVSKDIIKNHYNCSSTQGESKYRTVAYALAMLGEYFPFNPKDK